MTLDELRALLDRIKAARALLRSTVGVGVGAAIAF